MRSTPAFLPDWLQPVPESWDTPLLRLVARVESGHTPSRNHPEYWVTEECTIPWFTLADIWQLRDGKQKYLADTKEKVSRAGLANSSARLLPTGTVVLSRTASVGFSGIMPRPMATTQDFANFVCGRRLNPEFLLWALRGMKPEFDRIRMGSTHQTIYMPDVAQFRIPLPSRAVQARIADFLDRKTVAIDALIEKKERLIELLAEKRAALIHRAVTKGLNPDVPMKDSGVPWIGEIPAHWDVAQVRRNFVLQRGVDITKAEQNINGTVPIVSSGGVLSFHDVALENGPGVVVGRKGSVGKLHWISGRYWPHDTTLYVKDFLSNSRRFVFYKLSDMDLGAFDTGSANPTLNRNLIHPVQSAWPERSEQEEIAIYLDSKLLEMTGVQKKTHRSIGILREYRQALITTAVTGQLDIEAEES